MIAAGWALFIIAGGALYRWRGSANNPRPVPHILFSLPFGVCFALYYAWYAIPLVALATYGAVRCGHASYMDLGRNDAAGILPADGNRDEWYGRWIAWLGLSAPAHDFVGMMTSGLLITIPSAVGFFAIGHNLAGVNMLVAGMTKALAYRAGTTAWEIGFFNDPVKPSEILTGLLLYGGLALAITS